MIKFTKMHGLGNDFAVFNGVEQAINLTSEQVRFIANRHKGIGADQVIIVKAPYHDDYDFQYIIYNSDGSEVGQCGNAARCLGVFLAEQKLSTKAKNTVKTTTTQLDIELQKNGEVMVDMGVPQFDPAKIPLDVTDIMTTQGDDKKRGSYQYKFNGEAVLFSSLSIGNPHMIMVVDDIDSANVETLGPIIESSHVFPEKVNVGFMQVVNDNEIKLRVYERGAGETQACGSGACAAMVAGVELGLLSEKVTAHLTGGDVVLQWQGRQKSVFMTGSATTVFHGEINID